MMHSKPMDDLRQLCQKRRLAAIVLLLAAGAMLPRPALAGSSTVQLSVSLTIIAGCGVSGAPLSSGMPAAAAPATQQVAVNVSCDHVVPYRVETDRAIVVDTGSDAINVTVIY